MTGDKSSFLSLKNFKGGNVAFGNGKSGEIQGIGKVGSMDNMQLKTYTMWMDYNVIYWAYLKYAIEETMYSLQKKNAEWQIQWLGTQFY